MKTMKKKFTATVLGAIAVTVLATAGCSSSRTAVTVQESTEITKGRELIDLQRALEAGALTQREYEQVRKVIMRRDS
jgi:hypothetical protein